MNKPRVTAAVLVPLFASICSLSVLAGCSSSTTTSTEAAAEVSSPDPATESTAGTEATETTAGTETTAATAGTEAAAEPEVAVEPEAAAAGEATDCANARAAVSAMFVNWQIVIGMARTPDVKLWANLPIGSLSQFASQLESLKAFLGNDEAAADSITYMQGANEIVQRGLTGDTTAAADLAKYLGNDLAKAIGKQSGISVALVAAGC